MGDIVPDEIERYAEAHTTPPPAFLADVEAATRARVAGAEMLTGAVAGRLLELLVYVSGARSVLEIGTFTGYSALSIASALPPNGRVITCESDSKRAELARRNFDASPYADRIELRVGPALETIAGLSGPFELVFIDADKPNYVRYFEASLPLLAEGGLIAADNTLWSGRVLDPADRSERTEAIRRFNERVAGDPRVVSVMLTVRDGMTLIRRAS